MDLVQGLKNIGFTQQEANIYITLLKNGELSGYEVAKLSGISRSNVYAALSSLVEKGGAVIIQSNPTKYISTPKRELLANTRRAFEKNMEYLIYHLSDEVIPKDPYITISGETNCMNKIKNMILSAEQRIYISGNNDDIQHFERELKTADKEGLKVVIIAPSPMDDIKCIYYSSPIQDSIKLIVDTREIITGKLSNPPQFLYTQNKTLVRLIRETFMNEIELIKLRSNREL